MNYLISRMSFGMYDWFGVKKLSLLIALMTSITVSAKNIDLVTAVNLMTENNPSLNVFTFKQSALDGASYTANLKPAIEVGFDAENFIGSSPYNGLSQSELTVSVSSIIEIGGKRNARLNLVSIQRQLMDAQRQVKSLEMISQLTRSFIQTLATQERIKLAIESVQLANDIYESVKKRAAAGAISDAEVKRSFAALKQAELTRQAEQQNLDSQKVILSLYWAEKQPQFTNLIGELFNFGEIQNIDTLFNDVEKSSLINVLISQQQLAESKLRMAQTQSKSDLNWTIGLRRIEETNDSALTAGFSMPLFKSKRNSGALIEAQAAIDQSVSEQKIALLDLYGQIYEIYALRKLGIARFESLQADIIPALSEALDLTRTAYQDGRYGYFEYVAARQELIQAKKALIDTAENILIYGVEIEQITAESIYIKNQQQGKNS